jgi:hypothetical protein
MSGCRAKSGQYFYYECVRHPKKGKEASQGYDKLAQLYKEQGGL